MNQKHKKQHLTLNLTPLKQNYTFDSPSAPRLEFHYIMNSSKVFYLNLRMLAWKLHFNL